MNTMNGNKSQEAVSNSNNNSSTHHEMVDDKVKNKDIVKNDDDGVGLGTDNNNNNVANHGDEVPGGAAALPDPDVVMVEVGRALANTITRAMEDIVNAQRTWLMVHMPDGERSLVGFSQKTTVREINNRLAAHFGPRVYFFGFRLVTGLVFSAPLRYTVEDVDELKTDFGIGNFMEDWYEED